MGGSIRLGLIGAGANTRSRHIPGFQAIPGVELVAVCNRRPESTEAAARQFNIPNQYPRWEDLVASLDVDAVVIGTWPYLHAPITLAALEAGKHVLTEARMAMNATEARQMHLAAEQRPHLVAQIVPSPFGLRADAVVRDLIASGFLGELREASVVSMNDTLGGPDAPLHWRQDATLSGYNMLTLGIMYETLLRWTGPAARVLAQAHAFIGTRLDSESGIRRPVSTPDSVQVLGVLANGARATFQFSGVTPVGTAMEITLRGTEGVIRYDLQADRLWGRKRSEGPGELKEIAVPAEKAGGWRVEAEFIESIRDRTPVRFTDFATGVAYMEFTEAVARSARLGVAVDLPVA